MNLKRLVASVVVISTSALTLDAWADPREFRRGSVVVTVDSTDLHTFTIDARNTSRSDQGVQGTIVVSIGRQEVATCDFEVEAMGPGATGTAFASCSYDAEGEARYGVRWR